jgi:flagellar hook-associated protein 3 FlgL
MRISTGQLFRQGVGGITAQQSAVAKTQLQLATGKRISTPASDPAGSAQALRLNERIRVTQQHQENINYARNRLGQEEGAVSRAIEVLQRARELAVSANDAVLTASDRQAVSAEIEQRLAELIDVANTQDASGEFIFSGFKGTTVPFVKDVTGTTSYLGDQGQRTLKIGTNNSVAVADSGFETFVAIRNGNGTFSAVPGASNAGRGVIDPGNLQDATAYDNDTYTVNMVSDSNVAGGAIGLTDSGTNDTLSYEVRINGVLIDTLGEGDSRTLAALETAIDGATGTTGVAAHVDAGRLYLSNVVPGNSIVVSETLVGATEDTDTVTGFFGSALSGLSNPSGSVDLSGDANAFIVTDSANDVTTSGTYQPDAQISFRGIVTTVRGTPTQGDSFVLAPSVNQSIFATMDGLVSALGLGDAALSNALGKSLVDLDRGLDNLNEVRTAIGARRNTLDAQEGANADLDLELQSSLSTLQDLDFAEAASRLSRQLLALESAQLAFVRIQNLSLFSLLR